MTTAAVKNRSSSVQFRSVQTAGRIYGSMYVVSNDGGEGSTVHPQKWLRHDDWSLNECLSSSSHKSSFATSDAWNDAQRQLSQDRSPALRRVPVRARTARRSSSPVPRNCSPVC